MFEKDAEEIANKSLCTKMMCYNHCNFNSPKHHRCGEWHREYNCALAGLKAGRPQWHDLRKDPKDLPLTEKEVMVFIEWKNTENETEYAYDLGTRHFNGDWCLDVFSSENKDIKVIGWYDFPQFKE